MARRNEEYSVIGSLIFKPEDIDVCYRAGLTAEDFEDPMARKAYEAFVDMAMHGERVDPVTLNDHMAFDGSADYSDFLSECMTIMPTAANLEAYARLVKEASERQRFSDALNAAKDAIYYGDWETEADNLVAVWQTIKGTSQDVADGGKLTSVFREYFDNAKQDHENAYCKTGVADIDRQLGGGMFKSEVYIIGARPGMGKTTLGINIAQNIVKNGHAVLFCSMEMTAPQIQAKRISLETGIKYTPLITGRITGAEEAIMQDWLIDNMNSPFYLTTRSDLTVADIGRRARQVPNLACLIIDYIGLVRVPQSSASKPRYEQMTEISSDIKALAKSLNIPILALCQLNRENTSRSDKRPTMADLRDSGAIEQDAGAIILLHRPDYYQAKEGEMPEIEEIELNIAKNRHAEPGMVRMFWNGGVGRIVQKTTREEDELPF